VWDVGSSFWVWAQCAGRGVSVKLQHPPEICAQRITSPWGWATAIPLLALPVPLIIISGQRLLARDDDVTPIDTESILRCIHDSSSLDYQDLRPMVSTDRYGLEKGRLCNCAECVRFPTRQAICGRQDQCLHNIENWHGGSAPGFVECSQKIRRKASSSRPKTAGSPKREENGRRPLGHGKAISNGGGTVGVM
jgi:hypothetical protein